MPVIEFRVKLCCRPCFCHTAFSLAGCAQRRNETPDVLLDDNVVRARCRAAMKVDCILVFHRGAGRAARAKRARVDGLLGRPASRRREGALPSPPLIQGSYARVQVGRALLRLKDGWACSMAVSGGFGQAHCAAEAVCSPGLRHPRNSNESRAQEIAAAALGARAAITP